MTYAMNICGGLAPDGRDDRVLSMMIAGGCQVPRVTEPQFWRIFQELESRDVNAGVYAIALGPCAVHVQADPDKIIGVKFDGSLIYQKHSTDFGWDGSNGIMSIDCNDEYVVFGDGTESRAMVTIADHKGNGLLTFQTDQHTGPSLNGITCGRDFFVISRSLNWSIFDYDGTRHVYPFDSQFGADNWFPWTEDDAEWGGGPDSGGIAIAGSTVFVICRDYQRWVIRSYNAAYERIRDYGREYDSGGLAKWWIGMAVQSDGQIVVGAFSYNQVAATNWWLVVFDVSSGELLTEFQFDPPSSQYYDVRFANWDIKLDQNYLYMSCSRADKPSPWRSASGKLWIYRRSDWSLVGTFYGSEADQEMGAQLALRGGLLAAANGTFRGGVHLFLTPG